MTWNRTWTYTFNWMGAVYVNTVYATVSTVSTGSNWSTERVYIRVLNNPPVAISHTSNLTFAGVARAQQKDLAPGSGATTTIYDFQHTTYRDSSGNATVNFNFKTSIPSGEQVVNSGTLNITLDTIAPATTTITSYTITNIDFTSCKVNWATAHNIDKIDYRLGGPSSTWVNAETGINKKSGSFNITGRPVGNYATIYIRVRRTGSSVYTASTGKGTQFKRIAEFTSVPNNIDIDKPFVISFNRRDATTVELAVWLDSFYYANYRVATGSSYTFNFTETEKERFYSKMPNTASKDIRVYIRTNGTYTEYQTKTFKITNANPDTPVFTHQDTNETTLELTDNRQRYIQNYSDLEVSLTASAGKKGASIKKYTIVNGANTKSYTSAGIKPIGKAVSSQLQVIVEDSRGFTSQSIVPLDYIPYKQPVIQNFALNREIGTSTKADLITNGLYTNVDFGDTLNKISKVEYRKKSTGDYGGWTDITGLILYGSGTFNNSALANIDDFTFGVEFTVEIKVSDELSFNTRTTNVSKGLFTILLDNKVYGSVGIGDIPKEEDNSLTVKGNVYANNLGNIITAGISSDFTLSTTSITKLPLVQQIKLGNKLSISDGDIIIGAGVKYIKTSASVYFSTGNGANSLIHCCITKNDLEVNKGTARTNPTLYNYLSVPTATRTVKVTEGDKISLKAQNQTATGSVISNYNYITYITVEVVG